MLRNSFWKKFKLKTDKNYIDDSKDKNDKNLMNLVKPISLKQVKKLPNKKLQIFIDDVISNKKIIQEKLGNNELGLIKEGDEEEKDDDDEEINTGNKENKKNNDSGYLLENIGSLDESKGEADNDNGPIFSGFSQFRNTVNSFNNKKFLFPKLHNKLRDTIAIKNDFLCFSFIIN